ncbi:ATP-binding protein [uncultured Treponema sp.]|uniref:ATP-binding protein n=1 Tax=uncultured Treponema sp. TaxID=162155 RepID=UPI00280AF612|nr:ATP-binding protein [uncultured Treponema sp.]
MQDKNCQKLDKQDFSQIIGSSRLGFWKVEEQEGCPSKLYTDSTMANLIGVSQELSPEDCHSFFLHHIHSKDISTVKNYIAEIYHGESEMIYRYNHPQKGETIIMCSGKLLNTSGNVYTFGGYIKELTNVLRLEQGKRVENQLLRKNRSLMHTQVQSENYHKNLMDKVSCGIVSYTLPGWKILYMNAEAIRIFGLKNYRNPQTKMYNILNKVVYSDFTKQKLIELRTKDGSVDYECIATSTDGKKSNLLAHTEVLTTPQGKRSVYTTFLDISENIALKSEKSILTALCQDYAFVCLCDLQTGTLSSVKQSDVQSDLFLHPLEQLTEIPYSKQLSDYWENWIVKDSSPDFLEKLSSSSLMEYLSNHEQFSYRYRIKPNSTGMEHLEVKVVHLKELEGFKVVMGFHFIDEILTEEERQRKLLEETARQARQANEAKTNFLRRMSHDIRTPLNGIIGLLKIDGAHFDNLPLIKKNHERMETSANHLLSLINDVLQMSKLEEGHYLLSREIIKVNTLIREIANIIIGRATDAGIQWFFEKEKDMVPIKYIYGSPLHLRQIFLNIYGNCIKYNRPGGKITTVLRSCETAPGFCNFKWTISDTGIGMSREFLSHIFEPFAQERNDARSIYQGTGLGMSIVKGLLEQMGGTISITSREGFGSTFEITIPFEIAPSPQEEPVQSSETENSIRGLNLLLVEDNSLNAEIAQILLHDEGAKTTIVSNGLQALKTFEKNPPGTFDGILMDVMLPVMDGLEATRKIRSSGRVDSKTIPILAMTANAFDDDVKKCLEAGMNAHLSKPIDIKKIKAALSSLCRKD